MQITLTKSDGVHVLGKASLLQVAADVLLRQFAAGLVARAVETVPPAYRVQTIAQLLHHAGPEFHGFLAALLVLDAQVTAVVEDKTRVFPLPGFLSYRTLLPPAKIPLNLLRLPPLNPNGHYRLAALEGGGYLSVRLDLHPGLRVAGHVRLALARAGQAPQRLPLLEHRLERQVLDEGLVAALSTAVRSGSVETLAGQEMATFTRILAELAARE